MKRIIALGFLVVTPAFAEAPTDKTKASTVEEAEAPMISLADFKVAAETKSATIIDANGTKMYEEGHVPGAISYASTEGKLATVLPSDKGTLLVAYCGGPMCTAWKAAADEAKKLGYTNIKHFKGGIKGWKSAKLPVETGSKKSS